MRAKGLVYWFCFAVLATSLGAQAPASRPSNTRSAHERALEDPFDEGRFNAYLATLPRDGEFFVLEGDLLKTASEVRSYLAAQAQAQTRAGTRPELLVALFDGRRDYYAAVPDRRLRYFVDRNSFSSGERYERVLTAMRMAAKAWQGACPECQIELSELASTPSGEETRTGFVVRQHDAGGAYIAAAFFPHDPPARRVLRVDPSYFTTSFDSIGVLRHELGHVLGYRHEHTRGIAGCGFEDNQWQPLTPYDPHSVMHYFCGGGGSMALDLSRVDVTGHRALYGGPSGSGALMMTSSSGGSTAAAEVLQRFEAARRNAFDEGARQAFLKTLPKAGEYYVVEGDIKMTEAEVIAYLAAAAASETPTQRTPELLVNLHSGQPDFYPVGARRLTYVVDRRSFGTPARYEEASNAVASAAASWEAQCSECGIDFQHLKEFDENPAAAKANFTVRLLDAGGEFIAAAFFPHDPAPRRLVDIDPSFFAASLSFDKIGVLRHELGHVLGYRHEHIRGVPGCYREDNSWRPLTPYDARSVMHYFCGGAGSLKLEITMTDRAGHHRLYNPPMKSTASIAPPLEANAGVLVVSLEGGDVIGNAAMALGVLNEMKILPLAKHTIAEGDQVAAVYEEHMRLPSASTDMIRFASQLNGANYNLQPLSIGRTITYPDVQFIPRSFGKFVDEKTAAQLEENWKHILIQTGAKQQPSTSGYERVELRSYELRLPVKDIKQLQDAKLRIGKLGPNVFAGIETPPLAAKYHSAPRPRPASAAPPPRTGEDSVLTQSGLSRPVGTRACQGVACPEIVLLDKALQVHPDLKDAIPEVEPIIEFQDEPLVVDGKEIFEVINWDDTFHSTHLAGVIASRRNGFGLIGVDPDARIMWWDWDKLSTKLPTVAGQVADRQRRARNSSGAFQIYMFATSWPTQAFGTYDELIHEDDLSRRFDYEKALVIAAAGEADPNKGELPQQIDLKTPAAPMNQGNQGHVLVVTGCNPCVAPGARLISTTNFSPTFVHVAAPAGDVLSTAWGAKYAEGDGTSQATAFVTGLASAMVARYPEIYKLASQVKARLQVTSTPIELVGNNSADHAKLAAGIIDPAMATRDPRKHWLKATGANPQSFDDVIKWDVETLTMTQVGAARKLIPTEEIWRIVTINGKTMVYTIGEKEWMVQKIGPGQLSTADPTKPVVTLGKSKTPVLLGAIEDLLVSSPSSIR